MHPNTISAEARLDALEANLKAAKRKLAATWALAALGATAAFTLGFYKKVFAQGYSVTLAQLATRMTAQENKTQFFTTDGSAASGGNVYVTKANLHIRNGTEENGDMAYINGFGNLILGYNEFYGDSGDERTGSHNIVIGWNHDYTSLVGLVVGEGNQIRGKRATVTGGSSNIARFEDSSVQGGFLNTASHSQSSVSGGFRCTRTAPQSWAAGDLYQAN